MRLHHQRARSAALAVLLAGSLAAPSALRGTGGEATRAPGPVHGTTAAHVRGSRGDTARVIHLLRRATYGIRPGDVEAVLAMGIERWLDLQLHPDRIDDAALERRLEAFPAARMSPAELFSAYPPPQVLRAQLQRTGADSAARPTPAQRRELARRSPVRIIAELASARLARAVYSERQLEAVMTDFWFDHFNVFFNKNQVRYLVGAYEREAIRPHVFGRFEDMLVATAQHPAMLVYLDNWLSAAPTDNAPARGRRERGLNENYARELLELHTLGVDGGYTQQDVVEVARALTGWTIIGARPRAAAGGMDGGAFRFVFRPAMHDRGEKMVLGHRLPAGRGIEDGMDVLRMLARHPSTARHIATKLAQRFVADAPPPALVDELARVFLETDGDLREVTRALFLADAFYDPEYRAAKVKRPFELVASAYRATGADVGFSRRTLEWLRTLGHMPYLQSAPTGYPASSEDWVNSGAMLNRLNFALELAAGRIDGVRVDHGALLAGGSSEELVARLADRLLPGIATEELERVVLNDIAAVQPAAEQPAATATERPRRRRAASAAPDVSDPRARALGLILGAPEFQKH